MHESKQSMLEEHMNVVMLQSQGWKFQCENV